MPSHPPTKRQPITPKKKKAKVPNVNNPNRPPEENYNRLSDIDKCICYFYKINLDSGDGNIVGWNYKAAGSTAHFRHYDKIYSAFTSFSIRISFQSNCKCDDALCYCSRSLQSNSMLVTFVYFL